jgi:hypothetical protein
MAWCLTDQLVKKVILSVDILACLHVKLEKSVRQRRGGRDQEAASPFAGIIQIKFKRYNLRTSSSSMNHICEEKVGVPRRHEPSKTSLNTRHACFRFEKIPVDVMSTLLDCDDPMDEEEGQHAPSASFTASYRWVLWCCWKDCRRKVFNPIVMFESSSQTAKLLPLYLCSSGYDWGPTRLNKSLICMYEYW